MQHCEFIEIPTENEMYRNKSDIEFRYTYRRVDLNIKNGNWFERGNSNF